jgi:hypothetical protein
VLHCEFQFGEVVSIAKLKELWVVDNAAYGEASITWETFVGWWRSYPPGLKALFLRDRIVGALGIWPLSDRCAKRLTDGRIKESEITGRMMRGRKPAHSWYVSGIVLEPKIAGDRAIRALFVEGIRSWLSSESVEFPCEFLSLASSVAAETLLCGFGFFKVQNAKAMPDREPLFGLKVATKEEFLSLLRVRGLDLDL